MTLHAPRALDVLDRISERLARRYSRVAPVEQVRELVLDSARRYRHLDHPTAHARALTAQLAADRLEALRWRAASQGRAAAPPSFLFVCAGNGGRSQLAAALMRAAVAPGVRVASAGVDPVARILPAVIESLDELGVSTVGEYPKPITPEFVAAADVVVQFDCGDPLDHLAGPALQTWSLAGGAGSGKGGMRRTRDELAQAVVRLARQRGLEAVEP
ncbi:arsenate reductase ArsC [Microcella frigidaquae]|uniref:Phosphotyrosine protein phosphatase I domain-containing protein n=1 Tax=Microcella frigidaquae TaxID=424758 RepID=A0A840XBG8_9MICO|nr:hypothetical protein [Microcella frigidaquae]NHN44701.1 arsenate reductase ArsC [Microcella frigidaquae]